MKKQNNNISVTYIIFYWKMRLEKLSYYISLNLDTSNPELNPRMQTIDLAELFEKHSSYWMLSQVCSFINKETDTLYAFLYDDANNRAVVDVVEKASTSSRTRTTYMFDDSNITVAHALAYLGIDSDNIVITWGTTVSGEPIDAAIYVNGPVKTAWLANGIIKTA